MAQTDNNPQVGSGSSVPFYRPVDVLNIGKPGWPGELIIHDGKLIIYGPNGETLIQDGKIQTNALDVEIIEAKHIAANTITTEKVAIEGLSNSNMNKWARAKQAVVAASGGDFDSIDSALAYIKGLGGGSILLAPGLYTIDSGKISCPNVSIIGVDPDLCVIDFQGENKALYLSQNYNNLNIENITFQNSAQQAIRLYGGRGHIIRNCKFNGMGTNDILLSSVGDTIIDLNEFKNTAQAIYVSGGDNIRIRHNSIISTTGSYGAIRLTNGATYILLFDNYIDGHQSTSNGAIYADCANYVKIIGNVIKDSNGYGIYASGFFERSLVSENTVYSCGRDGIRITNTGGNCLVLGNHITYNMGVGLYVDIDYRLVATGNISTNNSTHGFYIRAGGSTFTANQANDNGGFGFCLNGGAAYITIVANNIHWNTSGAIYDPGITGLIDEHNSKLG